MLGHRGIRDRVEAAGLEFEPFTGGRHFDPTVQRSLAAIMTDFSRVAADRRLGRAVVEAARRHRVDAVVVDMILTAGIPEIVKSDIPTVVFVHCFYRAVQDLAASPVGWMLRLRGIDPLGAEHRGLLQMVAARADLDPLRGTPPCAIPAWCGRACRARRCLRPCRESWSASAHVPTPGSAGCSRTSSTRSNRCRSRRR